jgi:hypothetical protein
MRVVLCILALCSLALPESRPAAKPQKKAAAKGSPLRSISRKQLRDKIAGGWAGQMIGVSFGAPTEFRSLGRIIDGPLPKWTPDRVSNALNQDDLYVDMTFALGLDEMGISATTAELAKAFRDSKYRLWHANMAARRNLRRGVPPELAGSPRYNAHANDIDFQIESDFIGMMAPGMPRAAAELANRVGRIMNHGDGIAGGIFVSCMYATAFFEFDPRRIVQAGLACLPSQGGYAARIRDVLTWARQYPNDWRRTWKLITTKWDKHDSCPAGALAPFNIDASLNGAFIALGLLYGGGDFGKTIEISTRAGQDSDCNPSSAAGILGVVLGYKQIPDEWKSGIPAIANKEFAFTDYTFGTIVDSTEYRAGAITKRNGGRVEFERFLIRPQRPVPVKLQSWSPGRPVERIRAADARWSWTGEWQTIEKNKLFSKIASAEGAEASVSFEGTGALISGSYLKSGGKADVYLDGKLDQTVDVYSDEEGDRRKESVWHIYGLQPGRHTVRLVVRGEPYGDSTGTDVSIDDLIVFRSEAPPPRPPKRKAAR